MHNIALAPDEEWGILFLNTVAKMGMRNPARLSIYGEMKERMRDAIETDD